MKRFCCLIILISTALFGQTRLSDVDSLTAYSQSTRIPVQLDSSSTLTWRQISLYRLETLLRTRLPDNSTLAISASKLGIKTGGVTTTQILDNTITWGDLLSAIQDSIQKGTYIQRLGDTDDDNLIDYLDSDVADGLTLETLLGVLQIKNNGVGSNQMGNNAVGAAEIINGEVLWEDLATSLQNIINAAGGGSITNNEDDSSIKENASNQLYVNNHYGAGFDTLGTDTPDISGALSYVAIVADTISNCTGNPGEYIFKEVFVQVRATPFIVEDGNIKCGGVDLSYIEGDIFKIIWDGQDYICETVYLTD